MRIISGFLKGKKIDFPKSSTTRPLRDLVKENIFNIINHSKSISISLENSQVLDLYAGVGSFGIECISRNVAQATFVEKDKLALKVLKNNLKNLNIENKAEIIEDKIASCLTQIKSKFDIIFLDPPFAENFFIQDLKKIKESKIYNSRHLIVIHKKKKTQDDLRQILNITLTKNYGRSKIFFGNLN